MLDRMLSLEQIDLSNAVVIVLRLEQMRPTITCTARTALESRRILLWSLSQPDLREILFQAAEAAWGSDWKADLEGLE